MPTSMAILFGLISAEMPAKRIGRRKDFMMESVAYDIIIENPDPWTSLIQVIAKADSPNPPNRFLNGIRP